MAGSCETRSNGMQRTLKTRQAILSFDVTVRWDCSPGGQNKAALQLPDKDSAALTTLSATMPDTVAAVTFLQNSVSK